MPEKPDKNAPSPDAMKNIDAIGNRNVGCNKGVGNWYSLDKQVAMGRSYSQQVEHGAKMISDPVITEYVNRVGQNLVRNSDAKVPFTIKVIDTDEINAFALPGGFFYVNSGLILAADNEAELGGRDGARDWPRRCLPRGPRTDPRQHREPGQHSADLRAGWLGGV